MRLTVMNTDSNISNAVSLACRCFLAILRPVGRRIVHSPSRHALDNLLTDRKIWLPGLDSN
jgi:hypothetical protein